MSILLELELSLAQFLLPTYFKSILDLGIKLPGFFFPVILGIKLPGFLFPRFDLGLVQVSAFTVHLYPQLKREFLEILKEFQRLSRDLTPGPLPLQSSALPLRYRGFLGNAASFGQSVYAAIAARSQCASKGIFQVG